MGKKENISANEFKLKPCFDKMIYNLTILSQENDEKQKDTLHYIPNDLN